jgi:hypothetical protein
MNVMKAALLVMAEAYSKVGDREKSEKRAEELRREIDAACRAARANPPPKARLKKVRNWVVSIYRRCRSRHEDGSSDSLNQPRP